MSYRQIAQLTGSDKSTVHQTIKPLLDLVADPESLDKYRARQADIIDTMAARTIASVTDEDYEKASLLQKTTAFCQLVDKSRLISGQSTQNLAVLSYFGGLVEAFGSNEAAEVQGEVVDAGTEQS